MFLVVPGQKEAELVIECPKLASLCESRLKKINPRNPVILRLSKSLCALIPHCFSCPESLLLKVLLLYACWYFQPLSVRF